MPRIRPDAVILTHGLWLSGWGTALLALRLRRYGFATHVFSYPTVRVGLEENAAALARFARTVDATTVHFVGHSLGGLVIATMLRDTPFTLPGRVVTLATPYGGNRAAEVVSRSPVGRYLLGACMMQLVTQRLKFHAPPGREVGVIYGSRPIGLGRLVTRVDEPHDGVVTVSEARLAGATDAIALAACHSCMLVSAEAARQVCAFLQHGHFER